MTGFGVARCDSGDFHLVVEIRAVNGRFLKTTCKLPAPLLAHEAALEAALKAKLRRGTVTCSVFLTRRQNKAQVEVNEAMVQAYQQVFTRLGIATDAIPLLPGVVQPVERDAVPEPVVRALVDCTDAAIDALDAMRQHEGAALHTILGELCGRLGEVCHKVYERAPAVVQEYQEKLRQRLSVLLAGMALPAEVSLDAPQLAREVALFADRSDITEEVDRLRAHLEQARSLFGQGGEAGRSLEFLAQEMHREVNTIGAKSADTVVSRYVMQMKADIERFREQVANVE